jgi:beta propeller repeat protein
MKKTIISILFIILLIFSSITMGCIYDEEQNNNPIINTQQNNHYINPKIHGNYILWQLGNNLFLYNLNNKSTELLSDKCLYGEFSIYEDKIVFSENINETFRVMIYYISSNKKIEITKNAYFQRSPAIYENIVAWVEYHKLDEEEYCDLDTFIVWYDISTDIEKKVRINTNYFTQNFLSIYENIIVWNDETSLNNWDIYYYNIDNDNLIQLTDNITIEEYPDINGNFIVWNEYPEDGYQLVKYYNIKTNETFSIQNNSFIFYHPKIHKNHIVMYTGIPKDSNNENLNNSIPWLFNIDNKSFYTLNVNGGHEPDIFENYIVYYKYENWPNNYMPANLTLDLDSNIYLYDLSSGIETKIC